MVGLVIVSHSARLAEGVADAVEVKCSEFGDEIVKHMQ